MLDKPTLPFCFHPVLIFSDFVDALPHRLCADGTNCSSQVIVDDGRYLGSATDVLVSWEPTIIILVQKPSSIPKAKALSPRNSFDFWYLSWI